MYIQDATGWVQFVFSLYIFPGLSMTWTVSTSIFLLIAYSYIKILSASVRQGRSDKTVRSKAFQTCSSHLVLYVIYEIAIMILVLSHRFRVSRNVKQFFSLMFIVIPPAINPIIYGLMSKELRTSIIKYLGLKIFCKKWCMLMVLLPSVSDLARFKHLMCGDLFSLFSI